MTQQLTRTLVAAAALAALSPAQAVRTTTDGGTEIDFSSTLSLGGQWRLGKRLSTTIGNDNGGNVPTGAPLGSVMAGPGNDALANPDFNFLNGDDGNLNYNRGDIVSLALKGTHEFGLKTPTGWRAPPGSMTSRPTTPAAPRCPRTPRTSRCATSRCWTPGCPRT